jgi:hypothetical protein
MSFPPLPPTLSVFHTRLVPQQTDQSMMNKSHKVVNNTNDDMIRTVPQKITHGALFGGASGTNGKQSATIEASSSPGLAAVSSGQTRVPVQQHESLMQSGSAVLQPVVTHYHKRDAAQCGKIVLSHNEHLPSAFLDVAAAKNRELMEVRVTCIDQQMRLALLARYEQQIAQEWAAPGFSTIEAPPPSHVFSEDFRFMYQDLRCVIV